MNVFHSTCVSHTNKSASLLIKNIETAIAFVERQIDREMFCLMTLSISKVIQRRWNTNEGVEDCWNKSNRAKLRYSEKDLSQRHFDIHKFDMDWSGTDAGFIGEKSTTNCVSIGMAH